MIFSSVMIILFFGRRRFIQRSPTGSLVLRAFQVIWSALTVTNFVECDVVAIGIDHSLRAAASFICDHKEKSDERRYRYPR